MISGLLDHRSQTDMMQTLPTVGSFVRWLDQLPISEPLERRQALTLQIALLILLGLTVAVVPLMLPNTTPDGRPSLLLALFCSGAIHITSLVLLRRGMFRSAALISTGSLMLLMGILLLLVGLRNGVSILLLLILCTTLAALMVRGRVLAGFVGLSTLLIGTTAVLEEAGLPPVGLLPASLSVTRDYAVLGTVVLVILALLVRWFSAALRNAITESAVATRELEAIRAAQAETIARQTEDLRAALHNAEQREAVLTATLRALQHSQATVRALGMPIIPVLPGVVIAPLIGTLDTERVDHFTESVLEAVGQRQARQVLIDVTGVPLIDGEVAQRLIQTAGAVGLLGAQLWLIGVRPEVAQTLVALGVSLGDIPTYPDLQGAVAALISTQRKQAELEIMRSM